MKCIFICILFVFCYASSLGQRKHLILDIDVNHNSLGKIPKEVYGNSAQVISDSVMRGNAKSVRMQVNSNDSIGIKGIRAEFSFKSETNPERWYGLSIYAPADYLPDPEPEIVTQWHNVPDFKLGETWTSPSLGMMTQNGKWIFTTKWDTAKVTVQGHWMGDVSVDLGPVKLNAWTDWVFHIKFSYQADGLVEIFCNGKKVYTREGPNSYNDEKLPYWKVGIYKWVFKDHRATHHKYNQRILFYSQIREGDEKAAYKDVAPD